MEQALLKITGHVQGVWYRASVKDAAVERGLTGYAKNLPDKSVEVLVQGERQKIDELIAACWDGSSSSQVENVQINWQTPEEDLHGFNSL